MSRSTVASRTNVAAAVILAAVAAAWSGSLPAPFELDDHESILTNPTIRDLASFGWLTPPASGGETVSGRPVLNLSFAVNYALGGLDVRGYRAVNILLHALAAFTLFGLVRRTAVGADWLGPSLPAREAEAFRFTLIVALVWAVHPLQTAAVTYVAQRAESLAGLFYLLSIYAFRRSVDSGRDGGRWVAASVLAGLLGMATKETVATLPIVVLLYDRAFVAGSLRAAWRARWKVHLALAATWLVLIPLVVSNAGRGGSAGLGSAIGPQAYGWTQAGAITRYLGLVVWPASQVFDYGVATAAGPAAVWPELLLMAALLGAGAWALGRNKVPGFLAAVFFLALAPSSSVVPVATQTMAEHRMYLALAAVALLACLGVHVVFRRGPSRWPGIVLAIAGVMALGTLTVARNRVYLSEVTLWQDTVTKRPENPRARNNLGLALFKAGRTDAAAAEFQRAIDLQPNHAFAHFNLGAIRLSQRRWADAAAHGRAALEADPHYVSARVNLGDALVQLGWKDEAIRQYRAALSDDPQAHDARTNLAALLREQGRNTEAEALLRRVIQAAPEQAEARYQLGLILEREGAAAAAEGELRAAIRLKPEWAEAQLALANLIGERGDFSGAEACYRKAIRLGAGTASAHYCLGNALAKQRQFEAAAEAYREALALEPAHVEARNNLANCQLALGRFEAAIANYEAVLRVRPHDETVQRNLDVARELRAAHR